MECRCIRALQAETGIVLVPHIRMALSPAHVSWVQTIVALGCVPPVTCPNMLQGRAEQDPDCTRFRGIGASGYFNYV